MRTIEEIASIIKDLCDEKNISINKMLVESEAGARTYYNMIAGSYPSIDKIAKIASYLDCSVDYLLGLPIGESSVSMYNRINFFEKLCKYNVTNKELSEAIGVSTGNISDWKSGKSKPNIDAITKIADYLDCSVDYLLGRTDNPTSHKTPAKIKIKAAPNKEKKLAAYEFDDTSSLPKKKGKVVTSD